MKLSQLMCLLPILTALVGHANAHESKTITIATEGAFPPWNSVNSSGEVEGFEVDVGKALCERAKISCRFVAQAWDGIIPGLTVGKYDAVMAGMSITEKRKKVIDFSEPYALTSNYFVVANSAGLPAMDPATIVDLSSDNSGNRLLLEALRSNLKGRIVGVQGATNAEAFVREVLGDDVEIRTYDKQDNLNLDLLAGRLDGGLADYSVWKAFLDGDGGQVASLYGPRISGGVFGPGVGIGLRQNDSNLKNLFNEAILVMKQDGTLKSVSMKWFGIDMVSPP